jgi:hypothetical protein
MHRKPTFFVGALLLIGIGVILLLQNLGLLKHTADLVIGLLFFAGGALFVTTFFANRQSNWWAVIPGFVLAAIGVAIWVNPYIRAWGSVLVLGAIALAFLVVYANNRRFWWAILPAGAVLTLALQVGLSGAVPEVRNVGAFVSLFLLGIALTFLAVYFLPTPAGRRTWAIWPAGILLLMSLIGRLSTPSVLNWLWAAALIAGGLYLTYRALSAPQQSKP